MADNWGFGVNGLIRGYRLEVLGRDRDRRLLGNLDVTTDEEEGIDDVVRPILLCPFDRFC